MSQCRRTFFQPQQTKRSRRGQLESFFPEPHGAENRASKMALAQEALPHHAAALSPAEASPIPSPRAVSDSAIPASLGSSPSHDGESDMAELMGGWRPEAPYLVSLHEG